MAYALPAHLQREDNQRTGADTIATTPEWFDAWLAAFGDAECGIWTSGDRRLLIPYRITTDRIAGLPVRTALGATNDHTPRFDIMGELVDPLPQLRAAASDLSASVLQFDLVSASSRLVTSLERLGRAYGLAWHMDFCEASPWVNCTGDWEDYWQSRGKSRQTWARKERKLMQGAGTQFEVIRDRSDLDGVMDEILDVEASGWKGREGTAIRQQPDTLAFYTRIARDCADRDRLRLFLIRKDGDIIAFQLCTFLDGVIYMLKIGFREEHSRTSPGQVLQTQILRWCFDQHNVHAFDLLGGGGEAFTTKLRWANRIETLHTVRIFRRSPGAALAWGRYVSGPAVKRRLMGAASGSASPEPR